MTLIRVASWNAEAMFTVGTKTMRASPLDAMRVLESIDADIVVIPEFGKASVLKPETLTAIQRLSYEAIYMDYQDDRSTGMTFAILSKYPVVRHEIFELGESNRKGLYAEYLVSENVTLCVIGIHLDDRAEATRMKQVRAVSDYVNTISHAPVIVLGDFNAMDRSTLFARLARTPIIKGISVKLPHDQLRSVIERVTEMALGTTIESLRGTTELRNIDESLQPTISAKQAGLEWLPSWPLAKIDWIFVDRSVKKIAYYVSKDVGSDHRPIVADIRIVGHNDHDT